MLLTVKRLCYLKKKHVHPGWPGYLCTWVEVVKWSSIKEAPTIILYYGLVL